MTSSLQHTLLLVSVHSNMNRTTSEDFETNPLSPRLPASLDLRYSTCNRVNLYNNVHVFNYVDVHTAYELVQFFLGSFGFTLLLVFFVCLVFEVQVFHSKSNLHTPSVEQLVWSDANQTSISSTADINVQYYSSHAL